MLVTVGGVHLSGEGDQDQGKMDFLAQFHWTRLAVRLILARIHLLPHSPVCISMLGLFV